MTSRSGVGNEPSSDEKGQQGTKQWFNSSVINNVFGAFKGSGMSPLPTPSRVRLLNATDKNLELEWEIMDYSESEEPSKETKATSHKKVIDNVQSPSLEHAINREGKSKKNNGASNEHGEEKDGNSAEALNPVPMEDEAAWGEEPAVPRPDPMSENDDDDDNDDDAKMGDIRTNSPPSTADDPKESKPKRRQWEFEVQYCEKASWQARFIWTKRITRSTTIILSELSPSTSYLVRVRARGVLGGPTGATETGGAGGKESNESGTTRNQSGDKNHCGKWGGLSEIAEFMTRGRLQHEAKETMERVNAYFAEKLKPYPEDR
eukprot:jgi/Bigna1/135790/aug1.31_g10498